MAFGFNDSFSEFAQSQRYPLTAMDVGAEHDHVSAGAKRHKKAAHSCCCFLLYVQCEQAINVENALNKPSGASLVRTSSDYVSGMNTRSCLCDALIALPKKECKEVFRADIL